MFKNNKKYWLIPLSVICFIILTIATSYFLLFTEYILFEGHWGGAFFGFCLELFNIFVYIALSVICFYLIVPKLVLSNQMRIKPVSVFIFVAFIVLTVAECFYISIDSSSDFYNFFYCVFDTLLNLLSQVLYSINKFLSYASLLVINLIAPLSFVIGIKKKKSENVE